ncbi:hypothetical protein CKAN_00944000 [Cinnamomum micranthum f. kanehirae]|uniref:Uncharacterized protein n=1 Tax=Cinnamomum micranthum f. kanehirae TaxID=337451 RepID=A0A443NQJ9_9MAGN|nr:hypothetical protein CKAN_00944000 [Cinnamomum micranthum f. kanehirae]
MKFWTAGFFNLTVVGDFGYVLSASHIATGGEDTRIRISIALSGGQSLAPLTAMNPASKKRKADENGFATLESTS